MGHHCCTKQKVKRGLWSPEEDEKLIKHITTHGHGSWSSVAKIAGLQRCGKSCRLRWINYLRPDLKRGSFTEQEERTIIDVHRTLGNRWAQIAKHLPGRTDNEVKNFWNSCIKKKLIAQGIDPNTHNLIILSTTSTTSNNNNNNFNIINACNNLIMPPQQTTSPLFNIFSSSANNIINSEYSSSAFLYNNIIPLHELFSSSTLPTSDRYQNPNMFCSSSTTTTTQEQNNSTIPHASSMESLVTQASTVQSSSTNNPIIISSSSLLDLSLIDEDFMWNYGSFEPIRKEEEFQMDPAVVEDEEVVLEMNKTNHIHAMNNSTATTTTSASTFERSNNFDFDFVMESTSSTVLPGGIYGNNYQSPMEDQYAWDC
ncbi:hypothetical protein ACOSP7_013395 [Xanthoceras sorbifolium]